MHITEIVLSKEGLEALEALAESAVLVEPHNQEIFYRLKHFSLAEIQACPGAISGVLIPKGAYIAERGRDYLAYFHKQESDELRNRRHEIKMCIISAAAGSVFTLFAEHFSDIIRFIQCLP